MEGLCGTEFLGLALLDQAHLAKVMISWEY